jgi:hypothetical protein
MSGPKSLKKFKKIFPIYQNVPDSEFRYYNGQWMVSSKGLKQVAFQVKHPNFLSFINSVETKLSVSKSNG